MNAGVLDRDPVQAPAGIATSDERRLAYIDTLRGLASIQVLLSHAMLAFFTGTAMASPSSRTLIGYLAASPVFFVIDGASAVCIFFVLSGYVLTPIFTHSRATNSAIIGSRFLRLGIPALAACGFSVILFQVFGGYNQKAGAVAGLQWLAEGWRPSADLWFVKDALVNGVIVGFQNSSPVQWFGLAATSLQPMGDSYVTPLWTLSVEFYGSVLVLLLARSRSWTLLILAALILSRTYMLCFIAGHVAARFDLGGKRLLAPWPAAAAAVVIGLAVCLAGHFWSPEPVVKFCAWSDQILPPCPLSKTDYLMRVYGATVFTIGIMQCAPIRTFLTHKYLSALGRLSFPIYLTHWPVIFGLGSFLLVVSQPWIGVIPARFLALTASIAVTVFAATHFERIDEIALRVSRAWRKRDVAS
jgi:peptidoglycan/LPS O-acetylase OafA/YrhL